VYFFGVPRINMTRDRDLLPPPSYPGGLLGGAPKPSKLQALAAARKKKSEDSRSSGSIDERSTSSRDLATLSPFAYAKRQADGSEKSLGPALKRLNLSRSSDEAKPEPDPEDRHTFVKVEEHEGAMEPRRSLEEDCIMPKIIKPTNFGATLFGMDSAAQSRLAKAEPLPFPYTSSPLWNPDAFEKPSPDDIVISAQSRSKGSGFGGTRN
jgi:elongation factor 1 alpha-like protein